MRLAILSDIHDHVWHLRAALAALPPTDALLCCGDLCSPFIVGLLADGYPGRPIHIVFGNNDGDLFRIAENAARFEHVQLHGAAFFGEFDGCRVAMNHYPDVARAMANGGEHGLVVYGHDHQFHILALQGSLLVNPGALMGYHPGRRADIAATLVVFDTAARQATGWQLDLVTGGGLSGRLVAYP